MRCFPNVSQIDNKKKKQSFSPVYNDFVKGCKASPQIPQIHDQNAIEEEEAEELRLFGDLSVAEVDVVKRSSTDMPRGNVDFDGWIE